jgi:putative SOS response-associated peptidase YedK
MCGRATLSTPPEVLAELFGLDETPVLEPRFNIAPSQPIAIVRADGHAPGRRLESLRWGLVSASAQDPNAGARVVNVRVESMFARPAVREAARARRCLVIVDGFYEWKGAGTKQKQAFHVRRPDGLPFALGGLWDRWIPPQASGAAPIETCAILTEPALAPVEAIHDRMPVIIAPEDYAAWLDPSLQSPDEVRALTRREGRAALVAVAVGSFVNDPKREGAACLEPAAQGELL